MEELALGIVEKLHLHFQSSLEEDDGPPSSSSLLFASYGDDGGGDCFTATASLSYQLVHQNQTTSIYLQGAGDIGVKCHHSENKTNDNDDTTEDVKQLLHVEVISCHLDRHAPSFSHTKQW